MYSTQPTNPHPGAIIMQRNARRGQRRLGILKRNETVGSSIPKCSRPAPLSLSPPFPFSSVPFTKCEVLVCLGLPRRRNTEGREAAWLPRMPNSQRSSSTIPLAFNSLVDSCTDTTPPGAQLAVPLQHRLPPPLAERTVQQQEQRAPTVKPACARNRPEQVRGDRRDQ